MGSTTGASIERGLWGIVCGFYNFNGSKRGGLCGWRLSAVNLSGGKPLSQAKKKKRRPAARQPPNDTISFYHAATTHRCVSGLDDCEGKSLEKVGGTCPLRAPNLSKTARKNQGVSEADAFKNASR